jgi:hypothetical protein
MAASHPSESSWDHAELAGDFDVPLSSKEPESEIAEIMDWEAAKRADRRNPEPKDARLLRILACISLGLLGFVCLVWVVDVFLVRTPDRTSDIAWGVLASIVSAVLFYIIGRTHR